MPPPREHRVAVAPHLRLHVTEWGATDGWPVVILHGGSHNAACWTDVCRRLPAAWRVIVPDQRGHGQSDRSTRGIYSCAAQVKDLRALLTAMRLDRYALVGHSMGGLNALCFAATAPCALRALVLVDVGTETRGGGLARVRQVPPLPDTMSTAEAMAIMRQRYPRHTARWWRRQLTRELVREATGRWTWGYDRRLARFVPTYGPDTAGRRRLAQALRVPVLVVRGAHSSIMAPESARLTADLAGGRVVEVARSGHAVPLDNPAGLARVLRAFLAPLAATREA